MACRAQVLDAGTPKGRERHGQANGDNNSCSRSGSPSLNDSRRDVSSYDSGSDSLRGRSLNLGNPLPVSQAMEARPALRTIFIYLWRSVAGGATIGLWAECQTEVPACARNAALCFVQKGDCYGLPAVATVALHAASILQQVA